MTEDGERHLSQKFLELVYQRLEKIEMKLEIIDDRVRKMESSVAVLNFKTGAISIASGGSAGTIVYFVSQVLGS